MTDLLKYMSGGLGGGLLVAALVLWGVHNLEKVQRVAGWVCKALSWLHTRYEYGSVAYDVQASVNTFGERLNKEAPGSLPYSMKIQWARTTEEVQAYLRDGQVVVTMDYSRNQDRNLVVSTMAYLRAGLLPYTRPYMQSALLRATDFTVAKSLVAAENRPAAVSLLFDDHLTHELRETKDLDYYCSLLERLNSAGVFTRIFLRELHAAGVRAHPRNPTDALRRETAFFAEFLGRIQAHAKGEKVPGGLAFVRSLIQASVMLVAKSDSPDRADPIRYIRPTRIDIDRGIKSMYICSRGKPHITLAKQVANRLEHLGLLRILDVYAYSDCREDGTVPAVCIACELSPPDGDDPDALASPISLLYECLEENVEDIARGQIEVVALARRPGRQSRIGLRRLDPALDPVASCCAPSRLSAIRECLPNEELYFFEWPADPDELIVTALAPLNKTDVQEVRWERATNRVVVVVTDEQARQEALGPDQGNLACAVELTGYEIAIEVGSDPG